MYYLENISYFHMPFFVVSYLGGGFSEKKFNESRNEFEVTRNKYITRGKSEFFRLLLLFLNPIKNLKSFQKFMSYYNKMKSKIRN